MKIAMIQNNYIVGDFEGNFKKIEKSILENSKQDMIVFSELCVSGYYPWDLIHRPHFITKQEKSLEQIKELSKNTDAHIVVGAVTKNENGVGKDFFNSLLVFHQGKQVFSYDKKLLPTYNIFDEKRHFEEGTKSGLAELKINGKKTRVGFFICEDGWNDESYDYITNPVKQVAQEGASIFITINASPSNLGKLQQREHIFSKIAKRYGIPLVYVNQVGANDDIVFDGSSFVFDKNGEKQVQMKFFQEDSYVYDSLKNNKSIEKTPDKYEFIFEQVGLGMKDYMSKIGIKGIVLGCSGGVDSALVAALGALHLGKENVLAITMPSKYSSSGSVTDSEDLCNRLGVKLLNMPIKSEFDAYRESFKKDAGIELKGVAEENLQARIRGMMLMAMSNQDNLFVMGTSNLSETSVGYTTIYGDAVGAYSPIAGLLKTDVYGLCHWINQKFGEIIPPSIIEKAPSAELAPGQKDSDNLPDYDHLDAIIKQELFWNHLSEKEQSETQNLIDEVDENLYKKVLKLIDQSEFKRRQAPMAARVYPMTYGSGRKIPVVQRLIAPVFDHAPQYQSKRKH